MLPKRAICQILVNLSGEVLLLLRGNTVAYLPRGLVVLVHDAAPLPQLGVALVAAAAAAVVVVRLHA